jgi:hypothetical protein
MPEVLRSHQCALDTHRRLAGVSTWKKETGRVLNPACVEFCDGSSVGW